MNRPGTKAQSSIGAALVALMVLALVPGVAAAATRPITLSIFMGDRCLAGKASDNADLQVLWRNHDGANKLQRNDQAGANGNWAACSPTPDVVVEAGDLITVTDSGSSDSHFLIVPELSIFGNRVRDVYKGRAPGGSYIKLICNFSNGFEPCMETWKIHVSNTGKWSFRPGWDVRPGETIIAQWKSGSGDVVRAFGTPALLTVRLGSARVTGITRNGAHPTIVLKRGQLMAMAHPDASPLDGAFGGPLRKQAGNKVKVRAGDLISSDIAADLMWIVPAINATGDASTGHITGRCHYDDPSEVFSGDFEIHVYRDGAFWARSSITDFYDEDGFFDVEMEFQAGDQLIIRCGMSTGDWAEKAVTAVS